MPYTEKRGDGLFPWSVKHKKPGGGERRASGFATEEDAMNYGLEQEADLRRGRYHDPKRGEITLDAYFAKWLPVQHISEKSRSNHDSEYRTHIKPRWGSQPLNSVGMFDIAALEKELRATRSRSLTGNVMGVLRAMFEDAVFAGILQATPMRPRGKRGIREPSTARTGQVVTLEDLGTACERLKSSDALMAVTAVFTGMRWGEVSGVRRSFLELHPATDGKAARGRYVIDPKVGAVHEDHRTGRRSYGPPKGGKGRTVGLPPFLVELLLTHLETMPLERDALFVNERGQLHNHSSFIRNHWRPACDGRAGRGAVRGHPSLEPWEPVHVGLRFHDLRHSHKTWLAEDGSEPVARDERLGHVTPGMDGVYIHVTPVMRARVLEVLEARWADFAGRSTPNWLPFSGS